MVGHHLDDDSHIFDIHEKWGTHHQIFRSALFVMVGGNVTLWKDLMLVTNPRIRESKIHGSRITRVVVFAFVGSVGR